MAAKPLDGNGLALLLSFAPEPPKADPRPELVALGARLFADGRLASDGRTSCAACHDPTRSFTDGRRTATPTARLNTPTLLGLDGATHVTHDGRYRRIRDQYIDPLVAADEMGSTPASLCRTVTAHYGQEYRLIFGVPPDCEKFPKIPERVAPAWPAGFQEAVLATARDPLWARRVTREGLAGVAGYSPGFGWMKALARFPEPRAFVQNVGEAMEAYIISLRAAPSAFDAFLGRVKKTPEAPVERAWGDGFDREEWEGYELFVGKARCVQCHFGPRFTGDSFFNLGRSVNTLNDLRLGRALGLLQEESLGSSRATSTPKIPLMRLRGMTGAVRVTGLRGIAATAPYLWDGSLATLDDVMAHYDEGRFAIDVGVPSGATSRLELTPTERRALIRFLESL